MRLELPLGVVSTLDCMAHFTRGELEVFSRAVDQAGHSILSVAVSTSWWKNGSSPWLPAMDEQAE
jgi:hypothetical protein